MFTNILLATDGSDCSVRAAERAIELAISNAAKLTAVYVSAPYIYLDQEEKAAFHKRAEDTAHQTFEQIKAMLPDGAGLINGLLTMVKPGKRPSTTIIETAQSSGADLIIMGSHGRSGLNRLMLGSVANEVVTQATCAVLIVKHSLNKT